MERRVENEVRTLLSIKPSTFRRENPTTAEFTRTIGNGLFTNVPLKSNQAITKFFGEIIPRHPDYDIRVAEGKGGYGLYLGANLVLDCYENAKNGTCLASLTNDPRGCYDTVNGRMAKANCVIAIRNKEITLRVKEGHSVSAGSELSYAYGISANRLLD